MHGLNIWHRAPTRPSITLIATGVLVFLVLSLPSDVSFGRNVAQSLLESLPRANQGLPCRNLPGAEDVVVVMKTGSTELVDKFSIHLQTTFKCYPHSLVFSDHEETFLGTPVMDALENIDQKTKNEHPDFELWRRLRDHGRLGLAESELSGTHSESHVSGTGKDTNAAWKLDRWKFLPMANRTLHAQPDKKWYVFVEADTYIFWQTLLNYLRVLDSSRSLYIGNMINLGETRFAHGGTGFVLSHSALLNVARAYENGQAMWDAEVDATWAGDATFGKAVKQSGAQFVSADPIFQGNEVGSVHYDRDDGMWCSPTVSYHHISRQTIENLWLFEQSWLAGTNGDASQILRHCDMFDQYVFPQLAQLPDMAKSDWTNNADDDRGPVETLEECRAICVEHPECIEYRLDETRQCRSWNSPKFGEAAVGVDSGWVLDRVKKWRAGMKACPQVAHEWRVAES